MEWLNEPARWSQADGTLTVSADPDTDFWRATHYGFIRDTGHVYGEQMAGDFDLHVRVRGSYAEQYDQAGAMVRVDERHWLKTGIEYFDGKMRMSTVTTLEYSSWAVAELPAGVRELSLLLARRGDSVEVRYSVDDSEVNLAALVYLPPGQAAFAGAMCAAPEGRGFDVSFHGLTITPVTGQSAPG
jgi:uncharacterized protein